MRATRRLNALMLVTLLAHASALALGALRVCWAAPHLHAGRPAAYCAMHHSAASPSGGHRHHGSHEVAAAAVNEGHQIVCGCANDVVAPYFGPAGILVSPGLVASLRVDWTRAPDIAGSPRELRFPPPAPPPRRPPLSHSRIAA